MTLTLAMIRCPDQVAPEVRELQGGEFSIGRGSDNDWVLRDPDRFLSKNHCVLAFRSGYWQIADLSTNGTFLNGDGEPMGQGVVRDLNDGDRLRLGAYEIEVRIDAAAVASVPLRQARAAGFGLDPFATPASASAGQNAFLDREAGANPFAGPAIKLPADYDPLAPDPAEVPFTGPTARDHSPHLEDAFRPPRPLLPEDWNIDASAPVRSRPFGEPAAPSQAFEASPSRPPVMPQPPLAVPRFAPSGLAPPEEFPRTGLDTPAAESPFAEPGVAEPGFPQPALLHPAERQQGFPPTPFAAPATPAPAASVVSAAITATDTDLLAAFLRGAGLAATNPGDPGAMMEALGAAFRETVSGLRQVLISRAAVKSEFRIEQTVIRRSGNNPLKFSADDEDALSALLGVGRHTDMSAPDAIADALRDMRAHELATVSAMQAAARRLLAEFEPAKLRQAGERGSFNFTPAQKKAHAWDAFEALHRRITEALSDDFDSVFGKAFAQAYERAITDITAREKMS